MSRVFLRVANIHDTQNWTFIAAVFRPVENARTVFGHDQSWIHDGLGVKLGKFRDSHWPQLGD